MSGRLAGGGSVFREGGRGLAVLLFVSLAAGVAACASPPAEEEGPASLTGCYRFERGDGSDALGLPWGIVLEDEELEGEWPIVDEFDRVREAGTLQSPSERTDHPFGYWRVTEEDSVEVGHPGGGGVTLVLGSDEEALVGGGRSAGDALAPGDESGARRTYMVRAVRVECGEESVPGGGS